MLIETTDFNNVKAALAGKRASQYAALENALKDMQLQLKASDQAGKQGTLIFDPVGTNIAIKRRLEGAGFVSSHPVPSEYKAFGIDVDFASCGLAIEVQFSNYPFLINNLMRADLFYEHGVPMPDDSTAILIVITKAHMFDASNSTLYYEQAVRQLRMLSDKKKFNLPVRVVGLFSPRDVAFEACVNERHAARYSRTTVSSVTKRVIAQSGSRESSRCVIQVQD